MPQFSAIIRSVSSEKFTEILGASGRKAREVYFHRHNIKAPKASGFAKSGVKNEVRAAALLDSLRQTEDEELSEEVLRTWLLTKRNLLSAALDHLGIAHQNGLTDSDDVAKIEKLPASDLKALALKLAEIAPQEDVVVYLKFMGAEKVDEALA